MYTTPEALIAKYGNQQLIYLTVKDQTEDALEPDMAAINREIGRVDGIIDGYLRGRYDLPLAEIPAELAGFAEDMAIARIYGCLPERTVPDDVAKAAKEAVAWLRDVQKGLATLSVATLPLAASGEPGATGFLRTSKQTKDRVFDDATLDKFTGR